MLPSVAMVILTRMWQYYAMAHRLARLSLASIHFQPTQRIESAATAQAELNFPTVSSPTVVVITVTWSGSASGHGIFAPVTGKTASITWDDVTVWSKTTRDPVGLDRFYAARESDIITTAVVGSSGPFVLKLSVPDNTAWNIDTIHIRLHPLPDHKQIGGLRGVAYSPFRNCQNPNWGPYPSEADVREDLAAPQPHQQWYPHLFCIGHQRPDPRIATSTASRFALAPG